MRQQLDNSYSKSTVAEPNFRTKESGAWFNLIRQNRGAKPTLPLSVLSLTETTYSAHYTHAVTGEVLTDTWAAEREVQKRDGQIASLATREEKEQKP